MTDPAIRPDWQVLYALQTFLGTRIGAACGRRWRDWDRTPEPLGAMHVWSQYNDQPLKTAKGEDTKERLVPVHPELARILISWKLRGFALLYGRPPTHEDFIVPNPRTMGPLTYSVAGKALTKHERLVGIQHLPGRSTHGFRRFFISHARQGGARAEVLERITHNRRGDVIDTYTSFESEPLCEAMRCFRVDLHHGEVVSPRTHAAGASADRILETNADLVSGFVANDSFAIRKASESSGGGGNRTAGSSPDLDDSRTVSRTGIDENTSKEHEQNALPDILMTMSQIPDVNLEFAEVGAMFAVLDALRRSGGR